jgi:AraC family transcriptional regulator
MNMQPRIEKIAAKKFVGMRKRMSFSHNTTKELWQGFMPRRNEIKNVAGTELFSIEVYDTPLFFVNFSPVAEFTKWATAEVNAYEHIPDGMEQLELHTGLYAIFIHKGPVHEGQKTYEHIFKTWLPNSDFMLDNRPHLAIMGEKYKHNDPESEEEIAIPIRYK